MKKNILRLMTSSALGLGAMAQAATINVDGACSLVDAIRAANTDSATGGCSAGSGADTIKLESSTTYTLTAVNNTTDGDNGLPSISSEITINGNGSIISRDDEAAPAFRILHIAETGVLTLNEVTIQNGVQDSFSLDEGWGGGILNKGTLTLNNSTVSGSRAYYEGGGIYNRGTVTLNNSSVSNNYFVMNFTAGGGISNRGTMTLNNSRVSGNTVYDEGVAGGIYNQGTLTLNNSIVSGNWGSGIWNLSFNSSGILTLNNSIVSHNFVLTEFFDATGGGIVNSGTLTLINSTVSNNHADTIDPSSFDNVSLGGGIYNHGTITLINSTVSNNSADSGGDGGGIYNRGTLTLLNSIIANSADGGDCINEGTLDPSSTNNLIEDGTCSSAFPPDTDPKLGPLQDNGGPTFTHALLTGSPAIDAGSNADCPDTDQRGVTRPINGTCDIGAYEYQGIPTYIDLLSLKATGAYHPDFGLYYTDIQWQTGLEIDTNHFKILKSAKQEGPYQPILIWYEQDGQYYPSEWISAQGEAWQYRVFDPDVSAGQTYYYKLEDTDIYGITSQEGPVSATMPNP